MYGASALFFFVIGGVEALLIRLAAGPAQRQALSADLYNQLFTMHGVTMIFLVVMPLGAAFMNYLMPLQIGARDVAFPAAERLQLLVLPSPAASSSTRRGSWAAAPTAAGSPTPPTPA